MLKNGGQHDDVLATRAGDERAGGAHPEIGSAGYDVLDGVHVGPALANLDLESGIAIETLLEGGIIAGELELVTPLELQGHDVECLRG